MINCIFLFLFVACDEIKEIEAKLLSEEEKIDTKGVVCQDCQTFAIHKISYTPGSNSELIASQLEQLIDEQGYQRLRFFNDSIITNGYIENEQSESGLVIDHIYVDDEYINIHIIQGDELPSLLNLQATWSEGSWRNPKYRVLDEIAIDHIEYESFEKGKSGGYCQCASADLYFYTID